MNISVVCEKPQIIQFKPQEDLFPAKIVVFGIGGAGSNAVNRMIECGIRGVQFIAVNTDVQDLHKKCKAKTKVQIGAKLTGGRGAGGNPAIGAAAAEEDRDELEALIKGVDMVFLAVGMGGGTGTGAAAVIAKIARDCGALTVAVVTKPFDYEGKYKMQQAMEGIKKLHEVVDALIIIPNQHLFKIVERSTSIIQAYLMADDILRQGVQGISDLITKTGLINPDFADIQSIMKGQGDALMGIGCGTGENRAKDAVNAAIDNPLLEDTSIDGATKVLVNIAGPENLSLVEADEIVNTIKAKCDTNVNIIHGVLIEPELGDSIHVTVIATGFQTAFSKQITNEAKVKTADFVNYDEFRHLRDNANPGFLIQRGIDYPTALRDFESRNSQSRETDDSAQEMKKSFG